MADRSRTLVGSMAHRDSYDWQWLYRYSLCIFVAELAAVNEGSHQ